MSNPDRQPCSYCRDTKRCSDCAGACQHCIDYPSLKGDFIDATDRLANARHNCVERDATIAALRAEVDKAESRRREANRQYSAKVDELIEAMNRADKAEDALARVEALTYAGDDSTEWQHRSRCEGEPECPACWAEDIRKALRGEGA